MKTDIEIAHDSKLLPIENIAHKLGLNNECIEYFGKYKAKINGINNPNNSNLILVTATNPTPYGEGKTTVSIGLGDALNRIGKKAIMVLREPSLGPVFGLKGGATGGGFSQVIPMEDINLHFTGDFHAITCANNLLCSAIDNHIYFGNDLHIDINNIKFHRCLDLNERALRNIVINIKDGIVREEQFNITAASEIMSILCLSKDLIDLKKRIGNILIGYSTEGYPIYARQLNVESSMTVLLKDAFKPNLVQTLENNPVIIHGGPFANISHGCNSIIATQTGLSLADYVVTEAGFGADLGAEKFLDIKCKLGNLNPSCVVLVTTIKSLKYNAGLSKEQFSIENVEAVKKGIDNLKAHIENLQKFNVSIVVCLNRYISDYASEIAVIKDFCSSINIPFSISDAYCKGSIGAVDLANKVIEACNKKKPIKFLYDYNLSIKEKIEILATEIYHASEVIYSEKALNEISKLDAINMNNLPICIAKTQYSISDDKNKLGYPKDYTINVRDIVLYSGAGFITVLLGNILTMPGLPKKPNYETIYLDENNNILGLF